MTQAMYLKSSIFTGRGKSMNDWMSLFKRMVKVFTHRHSVFASTLSTLILDLASIY